MLLSAPKKAFPCPWLSRTRVIVLCWALIRERCGCWLTWCKACNSESRLVWKSASGKGGRPVWRSSQLGECVRRGRASRPPGQSSDRSSPDSHWASSRRIHAAAEFTWLRIVFISALNLCSTGHAAISDARKLRAQLARERGLKMGTCAYKMHADKSSKRLGDEGKPGGRRGRQGTARPRPGHSLSRCSQGRRESKMTSQGREGSDSG